VEGLRHHIRRHVELAQDFAGWVDEADNFELAAPAPLNLVCFRHTGGATFNQKLMNSLNQSGKIYLTHTTLNDQYVLRFCVGQTYTEAGHVYDAWRLIQEKATELEKM
jgi:aromatic-L-amino-acid decarboxylase